MKTSNLLVILGIGGIGYYLLKKKKPQQIVNSDTTPISATSAKSASVIVGATTPIIDNKINTATVVNNSNGQPLFQPPANTTWVNPPTGIDSDHVVAVSFGSSLQSKIDSNSDVALLIKNPSIKSKNNYYIDQYGNLIQAPSKLYPDGIIMDSAQRIAVWRKANGIIV